MLHFGAYLFAESAGVDMSEHNHSWTPEKLLAALHDRKRHGLSLKPADVRREDNALYMSARVYFGTFAEAVLRVEGDNVASRE